MPCHPGIRTRKFKSRTWKRLRMPSTVWYIIILVVTATVWEETSARKRKKTYPKKSKNHSIFKEAKTRFKKADSTTKFKLAPSYGALEKKTLQNFDETMKVMVGEILKLDYRRLYTWDKLKDIMDAKPFLIRHQNSSVNKLANLSFKSTRFFGLGEKKPERVKIVEVWFSRLVGNIRETDINLNNIIKRVSEINAKMLRYFMRKLTRRLLLVDQGILRFPDIGRPFVTLYRINLMLKCTYNTYLFHQSETSEIVGLFQKEIYYPVRDHINSLNRHLIDDILDEVDQLFSD